MGDNTVTTRVVENLTSGLFLRFHNSAKPMGGNPRYCGDLPAV